MTFSIKKLIAGTAVLIGFVGTANAAFVPASWTDQLSGNVYIAPNNSFSYTHYIDDDGFNVGHDLITNFSLSLDIFDDQRADSVELADIDVSGWHSGYAATFDFGQNAFTTGWSLSGLFQLNTAGALTVTVSSVCNILVCGDFNLTRSTLVARGFSEQSHAVPEPSSLALLGVGLLGVGLSRRRKTAATK